MNNDLEPLRRRDGTIRDDPPISWPSPPERDNAPSSVDRGPIHAVGRPLAPPAPRRHIPAPRTRNPNRAGAVRNGVRSIIHQLTHVAPWYVAAAGAIWFAVRGLTDSMLWAWVAAAVPVVLFLGWMWLVVGQVRDHYRGDALPPPGSYGRYL